MSDLRRVYWDSSCFISMINKDSEPERHEICEDLMNHARDGSEIEIFTSCWTIAETIRPRETHEEKPLPDWTILLEQKDKDGNLIYPDAKEQMERIWNYYHRNTRPRKKLTPDEANKIKKMFAWSWIKKVQVVPVIAHKAVDLARDYNLSPGDSLHIASAIQRSCQQIHRWDRDFKKTDHLIGSCEPTMISQPSLFVQK